MVVVDGFNSKSRETGWARMPQRRRERVAVRREVRRRLEVALMMRSRSAAAGDVGLRAGDRKAVECWMKRLQTNLRTDNWDDENEVWGGLNGLVWKWGTSAPGCARVSQRGIIARMC